MRAVGARWWSQNIFYYFHLERHPNHVSNERRTNDEHGPVRNCALRACTRGNARRLLLPDRRPRLRGLAPRLPLPLGGAGPGATPPRPGRALRRGASRASVRAAAGVGAVAGAGPLAAASDWGSALWSEALRRPRPPRCQRSLGNRSLGGLVKGACKRWKPGSSEGSRTTISKATPRGCFFVYLRTRIFHHEKVGPGAVSRCSFRL